MRPRPFPAARAAVALAALVTAAVLPAGPALAAAPSPAASASAASSASASPSAFTIEDDRIKESSGLAASRTHPGVYWTHNDSGDGPYVYAVDGRTGRTVATVTLAGMKPRDVEAVSIGPDGSIYLGDIGDNFGGSWPEVWIYRFPEPKTLRDTTVTPTRYTVRYDDGPRDAESLMVHPKTGRVYVVSKKRSGKGALYEGPERLSASGVNVFR
ncbi:WD40 repeat domain-containing protein, partial [Streptomyces sp. URMC 127]